MIFSRLILRIKNFFSLGAGYYQGDLYHQINTIFNQIDKKKITYHEAIDLVEKITEEIDLEETFQPWIKKSLLNIAGNKINLFSRIRIGIIFVKQGEYEPIHYHSNFYSFQIVLRGKGFLDEYSKINVSKDQIEFEKNGRKKISKNSVMLNFDSTRDIHGFGADENLYLLSIVKYFGFMGRFPLSLFRKTFHPNGRIYVDIDAAEEIDLKGTLKAPFIQPSEAYSKYKTISNNSASTI